MVAKLHHLRFLRRRAAADRGFTLLEVLIAVVLVLAIVSLLWPDFTSLGIKATRTAAVDSLQAACDVARSSAMSRLLPVRLVARERDGVWELAFGAVPRRPDLGADDGPEVTGRATLAVAGELPPGVVVVGADPDDGTRPAGAAVTPALSPLNEVELLTVLPDGTARASGASLQHRDEISTISVQVWSGRVSLGEWRSATAELEPNADASDQPPLSGRSVGDGGEAGVPEERLP